MCTYNYSHMVIIILFSSLIPLICTVPSQVTGVAVFKATHTGKPALRVTWAAPQSDLPISHYQVEYRRSGSRWRAASPVSQGSTTSNLLEVLDASTVYEVRIRAVSAIGNGMWSRVELETTYMSELCSEVKLLESTELMCVLLARQL